MKINDRWVGVTVSEDAVIEEGVSIYPGAVIGRPPQGAGIIARNPEALHPTYIGHGSVIGSNTVIYQGVTLEGNNLIGDGACIRENTLVGEGTIIGSNVTIQNGAKIGDRVRIVDLSHITFDCEIGDDSFISVGVYTMNDNSMGQGGEVVGPKIGRRVRIGGGAMLLPGVVIGDDAVVGAGAVVTHDVAPGSKVMGIPAKTKVQRVANVEVESFIEFDEWPERPYKDWPPIG